MTEKTYIAEIDRQTTFKLTSNNISIVLKRKLLMLFGIYDCIIESAYFDIIRPIHSEENVLDVYIAGSITSEVDTTKTLSFCMMKRVDYKSVSIEFLSSLDNAVEVQYSQIPAVTAFIICDKDAETKVFSLISNANEKKCFELYKKQILIFNYADNKIYTFISLAGETDKLSGETKTLVSTTYVNPVVVDNGYRLLLESYNGLYNLCGEVYIYNTLTTE